MGSTLSIDSGQASSPQVEIINNVSSSASTGGNSAPSTSSGQAGSGEVIQGESKANVKIYTEVDGEVVTDIDETIVAPVGENAVIEKSIEVNLPNINSSANVIASTDLGQASSSVTTTATTTVEAEKTNPIIAFLNKIFKYVLSIFNA